MRNTRSVYIEIFDYYELSDSAYGKDRKYREQRKQTIRKYIREQLRKSFPELDWSDPKVWYEKLTEGDRNTFKFFTVRDYMLALLDDAKQTVIKRKINEDVKNSYTEAYKKAQEIDAQAVKMNRQYFDPKASEAEQRKAFEEFCSLIEGGPWVIMPTFERWKSDPMTPKKYLEECALMAADAMDVPEYFADPTQQQIDHVILHTLMKYCEQRFKVKVDIDGIRKCLADMSTEAYERNRIEEIRRYNPDVEPFKYTEGNLPLLISKERLEKLDFINEE